MITKRTRYREIVAVLARHGIGVVDDQLIKHEAGNQARAQHFRRACEDLGTVFIKLGQLLSTRTDLLPDAYHIELAKLQDEVAPLPTNAIAEVIREDLDYLQPMVKRLVYQEFAGPHLYERLRDTAVDAAELTSGLPRRIDRILGELERGNLRVWTRIEDIQPHMKRVEHLVTRMNATILAAACIVGLAIVTLVYHPQQWQRWIGMVLWIASAIAVTALLRTFWAFRRT